jgi:hypothetical protein
MYTGNFNKIAADRREFVNLFVHIIHPLHSVQVALRRAGLTLKDELDQFVSFFR